MRKVIVSTYMSLDGVIEDPMWTMPYWGDDIAQFQSDDLFASDALLQGRKTYEGFAEAWSQRSGDAFTDRINSLPKYVASTTLQTTTWNATLLQGDVPTAIAELKQQSGGNLLMYGGGPLVRTLLEHKLVDEFHILLYPVVLGAGERLFEAGVETTLKLIEARPFASGVVALVYQASGTAE